MPSVVVVRYSEDFRENKIPGKIYSTFRDYYQINPLEIDHKHFPGKGSSQISYRFAAGTSLPSSSELEAKLRGDGLVIEAVNSISPREEPVRA